jgi:histidyl-tRNA synthetase
MHDILPEDAPYFRLVEDAFWRVAKLHHFGEVRTPVLEDAELFTRSVGEGTDIIHKEMYTLKDRSDNDLALRPEMTASVARSYLEHGMASQVQPVRLAYVANNYRYERPQSGRYREFGQFGMEVFGSPEACVDAEVIAAAWQIFEELGLGGLSVQIGSLGGEESRAAMRSAVTRTLRGHVSKLSDDVQRQYRENPLRILDTKDPEVLAVLEEVPPLIDQLTDSDRRHLEEVLEFLDSVGIRYELNPRLVRGFDYYTQTVFEFWGEAGGQVALGGGGRYDGLVAELGGPSVPAIGMAAGIERIVALLKEKHGKQPLIERPDVFIVQLGNEAKRIGFDLSYRLTASGIRSTSAPDKDSIRSQLKVADKVSASVAVIIGQKEAIDASAILRDMDSGMQETVPLADVVERISKRLPGAVKTTSKLNARS